MTLTLIGPGWVSCTILACSLFLGRFGGDFLQDSLFDQQNWNAIDYRVDALAAIAIKSFGCLDKPRPIFARRTCD
jgi:hypothetical protein